MDITRHMIQDCVEGKRSAQFDLYKLCYPFLKGICRRYSKDDYDIGSLLNMGFFKVLKGLQHYSHDQPFEPWCRKIMINHIIDEFRASKKWLNLTDIEEHVEDENIFINCNEMDEIFNAESLLIIIRRLPEPILTAFNMFALDGYSHEEIARVLQCSPGTSKWYVNQARKKLKEMLAEENDYSMKSIQAHQ